MRKSNIMTNFINTVTTKQVLQNILFFSDWSLWSEGSNKSSSKIFEDLLTPIEKRCMFIRPLMATQVLTNMPVV